MFQYQLKYRSTYLCMYAIHLYIIMYIHISGIIWSVLLSLSHYGPARQARPDIAGSHYLHNYSNDMNAEKVPAQR